MSREPNGQAVALADLVHQGVNETPSPSPARPASRPRRAADKPAPPEGGGWAGAVPKTRVQREPLNAGLPVELDLLRRLRRFRAETGIEIQDFVAAVLDEALADRGYPRP